MKRELNLQNKFKQFSKNIIMISKKISIINGALNIHTDNKCYTEYLDQFANGENFKTNSPLSNSEEIHHLANELRQQLSDKFKDYIDKIELNLHTTIDWI